MLLHFAAADLSVDTLRSAQAQSLLQPLAHEATRVRVLALFVSDTFGGRQEQPFPENPPDRSSSSTPRSPVSRGCLPTLHRACYEHVMELKRVNGSNVVPLGSVRYGVCRHRAILFKYIADR